MKILSLNMWGRFGPAEERWKEAARALPSVKADILCLQEAGIEKYLEEAAKTTGLQLLMSDYDETGLAILSRHSCLDKKIIPYETRSPLEPYIRKFQRATLQRGQEKLVIINTHLSWKPVDEATRQGQVLELVQHIKKEILPVLICGDFNTELSSKALKPLQDEGFVDILKGTSDEKKPTWDNANPFIQSHTVKFPDRRIDLMLANPKFLKTFPKKEALITFKEKRTNGYHLSDHYGVLAKFT
jgi:endonuclease/exonuclease/phosphatase family metal-dependent hydrolase